MTSSTSITALRLLAGALLLVAAGACSPSYIDGYPPDQYAEDEYVDDTPAVDDAWRMFDDLEFYGMWHWVEPFGWVWRPTVVLEWRPFTHGQWLWTEYGWTWISYEPFGWATSHYGFWAHDFALGWVWIPGYEWYPACVEWIFFDDYIAWAPLPYPGFYWEEPWAFTDIRPWTVVPIKRFTQPAVGRYDTRVRFRARTPLRRPPELATVRDYTRKSVPTVRIEFAQRAGGDKALQHIVLPPDRQAQVDRYAAERQTAFKDAYRDRNGYAPVDREEQAWEPSAQRPPKRKPEREVDKPAKRRQEKKPPPQNDDVKEREQEKEKQSEEPREQKHEQKQKNERKESRKQPTSRRR
jgi:hypothetical protein